MNRLTVALGTRPEIIKLAPVIHAARDAGMSVKVVLSGQHRDMALPLMKFFGIEADLDLDVMTSNQTLTTLSERILAKLNEYRDSLASDYVVVQGDTTTAFMAAYWAFCQGIPVAHVEAGLRTYDLKSPFPEEANRQLIGRIANLHFAPTQQSAMALKQERVPSGQIYNVGNTAIDALRYVLSRIDGKQFSDIPEVDSRIEPFVGAHRMILVTAHRRESFGASFEGICRGILMLADSRADIRIVYPVHPNPNVRKPVEQWLGSHPRILLCDPLPYVGFAAAMKRSEVLLTDSGGIQEEGPSLRKPIIVMREKTERPEGVEAGFSVLVGTDPQRIVSETLRALNEGLKTERINPYGDGQSARRIIEQIGQDLSLTQVMRQSPRGSADPGIGVR